MKQKRSWIVALVLALVLAQLPWHRRPAQALTYTVTSTNDSGTGSLRQAILNANTNAGADTISFNILMSDSGCNAGTGVCTIQPINALPALTDDDTTIDGYTQTGAVQATSTTPAVLKIELNGTNAGLGSSGLEITSADNVIRGLVIRNFDLYGIAIGGMGNTVAGNHIGTDADGTADLGNRNGVRISNGAQNNIIGGDEPGERNVISGNDGHGVSIYGSGTTGNTISGNYIGLAANGADPLGNSLSGVYLYLNSQNTTVGGDTEGERNVISNNGEAGITIYLATSANTVSGNYIGTDASGTLDRGNAAEGISINHGQCNTIEHNVISGNGEEGVCISADGATGNVISGNYIGTDANGTADLGNAYDGVRICEGAYNNTIGGDTEGERNVISGNDLYGVRIYGNGTDANTVSGNYIGTDVNGTADLGNAWNGVYIHSGAQNNTVGPNNVIAHNGWDGVEVNGSSTSGNAITQNSIFSNTMGMGIDLVSGANGGIIAPVIVTTTQGSVNIVGTACPGCTVEVFRNSDTDGEGETYVGNTTATAGGAFTVTVSSLSNPYLTATATDAISGTSEFSAVFTFTVTGGGNVYLPIITKNH